jgi:23S rRNA (pseudouridine1915-N3)-methyltransferase
MLNLHIIAIGRLKSGPAFDLFADYQQRLGQTGRNAHIAGLTLHELESPKSLDGKARQAREAELLAAAIPQGAHIFVLDEHGKPMKSRTLAQKIADLRDQGMQDIAFIIGGADGHGPAIRAFLDSGKASALSFGPNTWPHMLVRVMLAEQLYRALSILTGHPYHRE